MASLPSHSSWRRSPPAEQASSSIPSQEAPHASESHMNDHEYVHLNRPQSAASSIEAATLPLRPSATFEGSEPKKCWICQLDSTEDSSPDDPPRIWRKPCPCSLEAHDDCLLQWIAAEETPRKGALSTTKKLSCPQCGSEIKVRRPRDPIVAVAELVASTSRALIAPTLIGTILGTTYSGLWIYGWTSMNFVFGLEDTVSMLGLRTLQQWTWPTELSAVLSHNYWSTVTVTRTPWLLWVGLPSMAPTLILLRTTLTDQFFPMVLPIYFLWPAHRQLTWPPRPGLAFAMIPFMKTLYSNLYGAAFADLEKKWDSAILRAPREGETAEQIAGEAPANEDEDVLEGDEEALFDLRIDIGVPDVAVDNIDPAPAIQNEDQPAGPQRRNRHRRANAQQWNVLEPGISSTIVGALLFPALSSVMGNLLRHTLPHSWILPSRGKGLLSEKWGRSLVGGSLLVVLKDIVVLYCKWKKARDFGKREILDYVQPKDRGNLWDRFHARRAGGR